MNMNEELKEMLNGQIRKEFESAYLYLEFANFFDEKSLEGYSNYYRVQAREELDHAMLIYEYLHRNSYRVRLLDIKAPSVKIDSIDTALKEGLEAERNVTASIYSIFKKAVELDDYRSAEFLKWFVKEQEEEEINAQRMIDERSNFNNEVYLLDYQYGKRVYKKPVMGA